MFFTVYLIILVGRKLFRKLLFIFELSYYHSVSEMGTSENNTRGELFGKLEKSGCAVCVRARAVVTRLLSC